MNPGTAIPAAFAPCPACRRGVRLPAAGAVECACGRPLLPVESSSPLLVVPNRIRTTDEARAALTAAAARRRAVEIGEESDARTSRPLDPIGQAFADVARPALDTAFRGVGPSSSIPEHTVDALAEREAARLSARARILDLRIFHVPWLVVSARVHGVALIRDPDVLAIRAGSREVTVVLPLFPESLPLPRLALAPDSAVRTPGGDSFEGTVLSEEPLPEDLSARAESRWRPDDGSRPIASAAEAAALASARLYRPFVRLEVESGGERTLLLFDGGSGTIVDELSLRRSDRLDAAAVAPSLPEGKSPRLHALVCPECEGRLPIDRAGAGAVCGGCGRGWLLRGGGLEEVGVNPESLGGRWPFWRFAFRVEEGERKMTSRAALRRALGVRGAPQDPPAEPIDVPAFFLPKLASRVGALPIELGAEEAVHAARGALAASLAPKDLAAASPGLAATVLLESTIHLSRPHLVLRDAPRRRTIRMERAPL